MAKSRRARCIARTRQLRAVRSAVPAAAITVAACTPAIPGVTVATTVAWGAVVPAVVAAWAAVVPAAPVAADVDRRKGRARFYAIDESGITSLL